MMAAMVHRRKVLVRLGQVTIGLALTPACKPTVAPRTAAADSTRADPNWSHDAATDRRAFR